MAGKWNISMAPSQSGKVAIVTGANSGLGLETAIGLARTGAHVVMACRSLDKAQTALAELKQQAPQASVELMALDLADLAAIRTFAEGFAQKHARLDILCNNAGVMALPFRKTRDGFEMQVGTNHLGHFALTGHLLPRFAASPGARIVTVASVAHRWTKGIDLDDLNWARKPYDRKDAYGKSKLANLLFHYELDRRLRKAGSKVIAVAAHPGYSSTNIGFVAPEMEGNGLQRIAMSIGNALIAQPASMGALPTLYAATMGDVEAGDYIGPDGLMEFRGYPKKVGCRPEARDPALGARLWGISEGLTGVCYLDDSVQAAAA